MTHYLALLPPATEDWYAFDTTPLPVKHPSWVRRAVQWCLPDGTRAGFGRCAAKALWFSGFRLAVLTPLINPVPICWALSLPPSTSATCSRTSWRRGAICTVLADKGLRGQEVTGQLAAQGIGLLTPPTKKDRVTMPVVLQRFIAAHRNRSEGVFTTATDQLHLEHHRALMPWGLLTRVAGKLAALTLRAVWRRAGREVE